MRRKQKIRLIIFLILAVLAIAALIGYNSWKSRFQFNSDDATGNTCGNLNNGGLFAEYNGKIYFANPYDNHHLYVMDSDCTNAKKLNGDSIAYLNVCGNYIYYVKNNFEKGAPPVLVRASLFGVYRTDLNGQNKTSLYEKLSGVVSLCGNYLYYQHYDDETALSLYKIKIDGTEDTKISDTEYDPASYYQGKLYFNGLTGNNRGIFSLDTSNDTISQYYEGNTYQPDMQGSYLYYIDVAKGYSLMRVNTSNKVLEQLDDQRIVRYNIYGNKLFYQVEGGDHAGIYRMNVDGTQKELIAAGNFTHIHCTSQYTFFQYFDEPEKLYRVPTSGPLANVEEITIQ